MHDLFLKFLNDQCSPDEVKQLLAHFNVPENEEVLRKLITESLEKDSEDENYQWNPALDVSFLKIKDQLNAEEQADQPVYSARIIPIYKRTWFRVAAVIVVLAGAFTIYSLVANNNSQQDVVKSDTQKQAPLPGYNKATLTLADGSTLDLSNASNGVITQQGKTKLEKPINGQLAYISSNEKSTDVFQNNLVTPKGGQYQLIFSDGSKVWLNAATSIKYPANFVGNERKVELTGEAYFEIAKNESMPFKVVVDGVSEVEVLGTHFNVNAYRDEKSLNTTLLEGKVKIKVLATGDTRIMSPGEQAEIRDRNKIIIDKNANTEQAIAWKNGVFHFTNADLNTVFRQLSRWYDVDVRFEGAVPHREFSGEIDRNLNLQQVMKLLEKNNVFCKLQGKTLIVQK